jgi:outer membrane lipoprotein-sorting protein
MFKIKTKMILIAFCMTIMFCMSACSGNTINSGDNQNAVTEISTSENVETESSEENVMSEGTVMYQLAEKDESVDDEAIGDSTMIMKIGDTKVNVEWEDNQAVEALRDMAKDGDITIQMSMYGGFEQVGSIGQSLPRDDKQTTTSSGDIVLYSGNQMVVFYGSNSWSYTRLGHISDKDEAEMADLLSNGDVTITISRE